MKKEELRPIEYTSMNTTKQGWFHLWLPGNLDDGEAYAVAIIETLDGQIKKWDPESIRFTDR